MTRLIRAELLKLATIRLGYGLLAAAAGLTALFAVLDATRGVAAKAIAPLSAASGLTSVITVGVWSMLVAAIAGVAVSSGEFRHSTATLTYLATPQRNRVLAAKVAAAACAGAIFGVTGYVIAAGTGLIVVAVHGYPVAIGAPTMARYAVGYALGGALLAAAGAGLGSVIRSQLAAVVGLLAWAVVIEPLLSGLFPAARPYLPYTAATTLAGARAGSFAFGAGGSGAAPLPFAAAAALLAGVAILVAAVAARTTVARDVT